MVATKPVYAEHQRQFCDNDVMTLAMLLSMKTMESLQNWVATHSGATPLFSIRAVLLAARSIVVDLMVTLSVN